VKKYSFGSKSKHSSHSHGHNLTSLVDCFAIILIYLLMATSFGEIDLDMPKDMKLPKAAKTQSLNQSTVVQVRAQSYQIAGRTVTLQNLAEEFKNLSDAAKAANDNSKTAIVIQADRNLSYGEINPVVMAGLQAGFEEVQFAVLKEEKM
jgi:biopolymer transport protein ExbD